MRQNKVFFFLPTCLFLLLKKADVSSLNVLSCSLTPCVHGRTTGLFLSFISGGQLASRVTKYWEVQGGVSVKITWTRQMKVKFVTSSLNFDATSFWFFAEPKWCRRRRRFVLRICQKKKKKKEEACWAVERVYKSPGRRAGVALCECWTSWASLTGSPPAGGHCWTAAAKHLGTSSCSNPVGGGHKDISHCLMDLTDVWIEHQVHRSIEKWIVKLCELKVMFSTTAGQH